MAGFIIKEFGGRLPALSDRLIADNLGTVATNTRLLSGELRPFYGTAAVYAFPPGTHYKRAYRLSYVDGTDAWLGLQYADASVVRAPIVNDAHERFYFVDGGGQPLMNTRVRLALLKPPLLLGLPGPYTAMTATIETAGTSETLIYAAYTWTWFTEYGEESPPAPATFLTHKDDETVLLTVAPRDGAGPPFYLPDDADNRAVAGMRIYRSVAGSDGSTTYYRMMELRYAAKPYTPGAAAPFGPPADPFTIQDTFLDLDLANADLTLPSLDWSDPPSMEGIGAHPNSFLFGWSGRNIYFSAVGMGHAWPTSYQIAVDAQIVGIAVLGMSLVILTIGSPWVCSGVSPDTMTLAKIAIAEPCLARNTIVEFPEAIYYISPNGLVAVTGNTAAVATLGAVERDTWLQEYAGAQFAVRYESQYFALVSTTKGFIFDNQATRLASTFTAGAVVNQQAERVAFIDVVLAIEADALWTDFNNGEIYSIHGVEVRRHNATEAEPVPYVWRSKQYVTPDPANFGVIQVNMDDAAAARVPGRAGVAIPATDLPPDKAFRLRVIAGGRIVVDVFLDRSREVALPTGFKTDEWQFEVLGRVPLYSMKVAATKRELAKI